MALSEHEIAARGVARGLLTQAELDQCLAERRRLLKDGLEVSLRELLLERGHLDLRRWRALEEDERPAAGVTSGPAASTPGRSLGDTAGGDSRGAAAGPRGEVLGSYRIVSELGRGAMGIVYEAVQEKLGRRVALKVLPETQALQGVARERFVREAQATASLVHPGIVPIYDIGEERGVHFFAMELVEGRSLKKLLEQHPSGVAAAEAARIAHDTAEALAYAHEQGVVHRDVKPDNVIVRADGRVVITDFGLAQRISDATLTREGTIVGTPLYMAPEQARGDGRPVDGRADVYCLGVTLYELLSGKAPFEDSADTGELLERVVHDDPLPLARLAPQVPAPLLAIVEVALEKDPARRFQTARAMADDLARFQRGEPILARPPTRVTRALRALRRRARALALASLVGSLLCLGGWGLRLGLRRWDADRHVLEALRLQGGGDLVGAQAALGRALEAWPELAEARYRRAQLRLLQGEAPQAARADLDQALLDDPRHADALILRGSLRRAAGELEPALGDFERARLGSEGRDARAHLGEGLVLSALGRGPEAQLRLREGLALARQERAAPDALYVEAVLTLGSLLLEQGDERAALPELEEAVRLRPDEGRPQLLLARALGATGKPRAAIEALSAALRRDAQDSEARALRGIVARESGDYPLAIGDLEQVSDQPRARLARGLLRMETIAHVSAVLASFEDTGARDDLEAVADDATLRPPERALAFSALAWLELAAERPRRARAMAQVEKALELCPEARGPRLLRARLLLEQERPEESEAELRRLPRDDYAVMVMRARAHGARGELEPARRLLDQAVELAPDRPTAWGDRYLLRQKGGDGSATDDRQRAIQLREPPPARPFALDQDPFLLAEDAYARGYAHFATLIQSQAPQELWYAHLSRAEAWVARALLFDPGSLCAATRLGSLHYLNGHPVEAAAAYGRAHDLDPSLTDARLAQAVCERDLIPEAGAPVAAERLRGLLALGLAAPIEATARFELAKTLVEQKDLEGAMRELEAAAQAGPGLHAVASLRSRLASRLGRADALDLAATAARLFNEGQHDTVRGFLYATAADRFEDDQRDVLARHFCLRALESDPKNAQAWRTRARLTLRKPDELPQAFIDTFMLAELNPSDVDRFLEVESRVDRFSMLLPFFEERVDDLLRELPDMPAPYFFKGYLVFYQGRWEESLPWFTRAQERMAGRSHLAHSYRGAAQLRLGRLDEAAADIARANELAPTAALPQFWRASLLSVQGQREEAIVLLQAIAARGISLRDQIERSKELAPLRDDPRVALILRSKQ